ncbi:putative sulfur metabolism negative regulator [Rosellinia necatrix]|uniref:Putative sulfur metabolism negative regulator n=1 Tax=Rosellinia necatrix TaxID=77044 RepID=A0A1S7UIW6_ROSNE|nr:putative sulfur metabolism negative regulator [Rosellinia necatrix]
MAAAVPAGPAAGPTVIPADEDDLQLTRTGFNPTVDDVLDVRDMLVQLRIPIEVVLDIVSFASYYPRQSNIKQFAREYVADHFWSPGPQASITGLYMIVATLPFPDDGARARSITFQIKGADQGWADFGGHGTYHNSHTWYEASILRPRHGEPGVRVADLASIDIPNFRSPEDARAYLEDHGWTMVPNNDAVAWRVHNNITARSESKYYRVDWVAGIPTVVEEPQAMGDGQGFLELLRSGDIVGLWARAEQQAWVNKIQGATMEIEYEVL